MPQPRRYRDQPVETFNLTPRSKAYACFTDQGYTIARDAFLSKFLSLASEVGPWAGDTLTCLYNYLIASIKLCNYDEAEEQCKYISGLIYSLRMGEEQCFMCLQCILATSCFLSGKLAEAEHLYTNIYLRRTRSQAHVREHFDVLSLVRYTSRDCLVLWESPLELSVLMPVTNYVDQLDERRPQKNAIRSQIGALCRLAPLIRHSPTHSSRDGTDVRRLRTLQIQRALRQQAMAVVDSGRAERYIRFKLPSPGFFAATSPLISAANGERIVFPKIRSDRGELGEVKKAEKVVDLGFHARNHTVIEPVQHRVAKWLNDQKQRPPMPDEPLDVVFDGLGLTHRSSETTSSSLHGQNPQNQLEVSLWAADVPMSRSILLTALLDGGAIKTCISEGCAQLIEAPINEQDKVPMITANGQALEVLGSVKIHVMWKGTSVSKIPPEVRCYVVRDLEPAMLFGSNHIAKFRLRESPALQAAILLGGRSQQQRDNDVRRSQQIAALATANEQLEAERRRAERANLEQLAAPVDNTQMPGVTMNSMMSGRSDSLLGGSCTSASSPKSSSTGFDSGMATTPSDESMRSGSSMGFSRPKSR